MTNTRLQQLISEWITNQTEKDTGDFVDALAALGVDPGAISRFNSAVRGRDVRDDITLSAIIIAGFLKYACDKADEVPDNITEILNDLELAGAKVGEYIGYNGVTPFEFHENQFLSDHDTDIMYINAPESSSRGYCYGIMACKPGDVFVVNGTSYNGHNPRAWYFLKTVDADTGEHKVLRKEESGVITNNKIIVAPAETTYCVVHDKITAPSTVPRESYKGLPFADRIELNYRDLQLYKEGLEPLESGTLTQATGLVAVIPYIGRIRTVNYLSLSVYKSIQLPVGWKLYWYAFDVEFDENGANYIFCGTTKTSVRGINSSDILTAHPNAKYIKLVIFNEDTPGLNDDITDQIDILEKNVVYTKYGETGSIGYPKLTDAQKSAIKNLADAYLGAVNRFAYAGGATINDYAGTSNIIKDEKYKICCSLFAQMMWMGRDIADFPVDGSNKAITTGENAYEPTVHRAQNFDSFGYYFDFVDRAAYGLHGDSETDYYGFKNPYEDDTSYKGSYSYNTWYNPRSGAGKKQSYNEFLYASDMARECDLRGYTIPLSEIQTGDLLFIRRPVLYPPHEEDTFASVSYKNITHVAMVYDRSGDNITIVESTGSEHNGVNIPIIMCSTAALSSNSSSDDKWRRARATYLINNVVMCARHPVAFGAADPGPITITTK